MLLPHAVTTHKKTNYFINVLLAVAILCIGIGCGILLDKSKAFAEDTFWNGTANGMIVEQGELMEIPMPDIYVNSTSVGQDSYPTGATFELKNLQVGDLTYLTLYVHNNSKKITNIYPIITATKNIEVTSPLANCKTWPGGWVQFVFPIRALNIGQCSVNIGFVGDDVSK